MEYRLTKAPKTAAVLCVYRDDMYCSRCVTGLKQDIESDLTVDGEDGVLPSSSSSHWPAGPYPVADCDATIALSCRECGLPFGNPIRLRRVR